MDMINERVWYKNKNIYHISQQQNVAQYHYSNFTIKTMSSIY